MPQPLPSRARVAVCARAGLEPRRVRDRRAPWHVSWFFVGPKERCVVSPAARHAERANVRSVTETRLTTWTLIGAISFAVSALPAHGADSKALTIRLTSTTTALELVQDREPTNILSAGDVIRARSTLRNAVPQFGRPKGSVVGRDVELVTMVASAEGNVRVTATLPGGTIRSSGKDRAGPDQPLRVTGGTGRFAGARGVVDVRLLDARTRRASNVYRLQLP